MGFRRWALGFGLSALGSGLVLGSSLLFAQQGPDLPAVTVGGQTYTPRSILSRNMGTDEDQTTAFPPHKIAGNIYYVGTRTLSSFLITTPAGHILINSTYERNVRTIEKSVAQLGFKFSDVKILLGTHAHGDHQEGDALVKELTGAQVLAMREDVPALEAIKPGGKRISFVTQGDANTGREHWRVAADGQLGRVSYVVPKLGFVAAEIGTPAGRIGLVAVPALLLGLMALRRIWFPTGRRLDEHPA